jgi:ketol-acid reductoisomerase
MTAKMYYDADADATALAGQKIAIIGYGSQGHAHAQNLRDSGYDVTVVEANPKARALAEEAGIKTAEIADAVKAADVIMILVPDTIQKKVYETSIEPNMHAGQLLMFAHGFNIRFDRIRPGEGIDVSMVAPKGPGHLVRSVFEQGGGVPALFAVEKDATGTARARTLAYARGIGATRAGVLETTFKEETETDLFGEQVVLCGGVTSLIRNGFETLVEAGYQPELAYFEVMHELKLIVDLMYRGGMNFMRFSVSDTAEYGDYVSGPRIVDARVRAEMKQVLTEIQDGTFAAAWIAENEAGQPNFKRMREAGRDHQVEQVGARLRKAMPFLNPVEVVDGQPQASAKSKD